MIRSFLSFIDSLMPHGSCWLWDWRIITIHNLSDILTFIAYMLIPALAIYIYKYGQLQTLASAFPRLWRLGAAFVLFCGLSHLGNFLEVWYGGAIYLLTGANKLVMSIVSLWFVHEFWKNRNVIAFSARAIQKLKAEYENDSLGG